MKLSNYVACLAIATSATNAASIPEINAISLIEGRADAQPRAAEVVAPEHSLERRKGGGGRGGGGGSSGGGRSSSGSGGGRSGSSGGSGAPRAYGGGYYGGGAAVPYRAGSKTPKGLVAAPLLLGSAALLIMPGLWLHSVYPYHFNSSYSFLNRTDNDATHPNGTNTTLPVTCLCEEYNPCGCEDNDSKQYLSDLVGNGSYAALNKSLVTVSNVNGTRNLVVNGTLPNGTTAPDSAATTLQAGRYAGYWVMATIVLTGVMM